MKINIENLINQSIGCIKNDSGSYAYCLKEFIENLKEVKVRHEQDKSKEILNEFFKLYVFNENIKNEKTV